MKERYDCSQLKGYMRNLCEGSQRKYDGTFYSIKDRIEILSRYTRQDLSVYYFAPSVSHPSIMSSIGTMMHEIIERDVGRIECSDCRDEITRLNLMTVDQVQQEKNSIAAGIVDRGKKKAPKFWMRWGARLAPGVAFNQAIAWIDEACESEQNEG